MDTPTASSNDTLDCHRKQLFLSCQSVLIQQQRADACLEFLSWQTSFFPSTHSGLPVQTSLSWAWEREGKKGRAACLLTGLWPGQNALVLGRIVTKLLSSSKRKIRGNNRRVTSSITIPAIFLQTCQEAHAFPVKLGVQ